MTQTLAITNVIDIAIDSIFALISTRKDFIDGVTLHDNPPVVQQFNQATSDAGVRKAIPWQRRSIVWSGILEQAD